MNILVTGAAGVIGFHTCLALQAKHMIYGLDNLNDYYDVNLKKSRLKLLKKYKNFKFLKTDIQNKNLYTKFKRIKLDVLKSEKIVGLN